MGAIGKEQDQDESRREAIIGAAARVFAERGFSGTSNREVAREAGISPGLIYWYFQDKEDLFKSVVARLFPLYALEIPDQGADDLPLGQLLETVGTRFMGIMAHPDVVRLARLALTEMIRFPEVFQEIGRMIAEQAIERLAVQLDRRVERGEVVPINTRLVSQAFFGSLAAYVLRKYMYQSADLQETPDEEMVRTVVRVFATGLSQDALTNHEPGASL